VSPTSRRKAVTITRAGAWCAEQAGAVLEFPFGPDPAVYKVGGKIFALISLNTTPGRMSVKVDPEDGVALRAQYECIIEGYHLNKRHWVTVNFVEEINPSVVHELIIDSHAIVRESLPKKLRDTLS
jgi:predicted DNA-binding protein (MmcQ/YjbR family)